MQDDPIDILRRLQQEGEAQRRQSDAAARATADAEIARAHRANEELAVLVDVLRRDAIPTRPLYRLTKEKSAVGKLWRQTSFREYEKVGDGWLIAEYEVDYENLRATQCHMVLAHDGLLYTNAYSVWAHNRGGCEYRVRHGAGWALGDDGWGGRQSRCLPSEVIVRPTPGRRLTDTWTGDSMALRLGVSAEETARLFFHVMEQNRDT